jgi:hypothetical protein
MIAACQMGAPAPPIPAPAPVAPTPAPVAPTPAPVPEPARDAQAPDAVAPLDAALPAPPAVDTRPVLSAAVVGYQLMVRRRDPGGGDSTTPYDIRGISWSPAERGGQSPGADAFVRAAARDLPLMQQASINTIKTYRPLEPAVLDECLRHGILAIITVAATAADDYAARVMALRDHPAVLMWMVGNEWNRNSLFGSCAGDGCYARVDAIARDIKRLDPRHPVATSFAPTRDLPTDADLMRLPAVDVWGLNVYSQPGFFQRFQDWRLMGVRTAVRKPFFMSEYGSDAYDNRSGRVDEAAQADSLARQTREIRAQLSARNPALPCLGGTPFEWSDEWWKAGSPQTQDPGGFANAGVAADSFANEDWWGVVDIDRRPRAAYQALQEQYAR